jgi:hypothetical protein
MIRALWRDRNPSRTFEGIVVQCDGMILCKDRADLRRSARAALVICCSDGVELKARYRDKLERTAP